jgi:mono/diheme cytochrome c family protein
MKSIVIAWRRPVTLGLLSAGLACNAAPPVPENPPLPGAPDFGPTTLQDVAPPPVSGGTMLLSRDATTAIVSDPDRDFVSLVDIAQRVVRAQVSLSPGDEPGRIVEDSGGQVHVALRGSGAVATISLATGQLVDRQPVCPQPRGVAYDPTNDQVLVACATGELATLPAASGAVVQVVTIEPGLRDVIVDGDSIFVSKFRTAEILSVTRTGTVTNRVFLPGASAPTPGAPAPGSPSSPPSGPISGGATAPASPGEPLMAVGGLPSGASVALAWRMRLTSDHQIMAAYQVDSTSFVATTPGGYGGGFTPPIVQTAVATVSPADMTTTLVGSVQGNVMPVDIAVAPEGTAGTSIVVAAGNWKSPVTPAYSSVGPGAGVPAAVQGQIIAAEIGQDGTLFLQSREPARLYLVRPNANGAGSADAILNSIVLSDVSREDTGHTIFHTNSGGSLACGSCHGEGGDDAQTWNFNGTKPRRTPSLLGTVKGTAPYHWDADFADLQALVQNVYTGRMSGPALAAEQLAALRAWLEQLPAPKRPAQDPAALARGQALFVGKGACGTCHSGPSYTNNETIDVGTGAKLQVPPLVGVGARSPFLHTGCAATLTERFTKCATSAHGLTSNLTTSEVSDLVAFLNAL